MPYVGRQPTPSPVTADDIPANSIDASKIVDGAIAVADVADNAITEDKIADAAVVNLKSGRKNLVINGGFDVWQRGTSSTAVGYTHTDRWKMDRNTNDTWTFSKYDIPVSGEAGLPRHITNAIKIAQTAGTTGALNDFRTKLENPEMFIGQTVTLSFYARATNSIKLSGNTRIYIMSASGGNIGSNLAEATLTTTWQRFTRTVTFANASTHTYNNSSHLDCILSIQPNITSDIYITGVQIELGDTATDFEHRSYGEELALCQRYYYRIETNAHGFLCIGNVDDAHNAQMFVAFPVEMRTAPTALETTGTATDYYLRRNTNLTLTAAPTFITASTAVAFFNAPKNNHHMSSGDCVFLRDATATDGTYLAWSAEL